MTADLPSARALHALFLASAARARLNGTKARLGWTIAARSLREGTFTAYPSALQAVP